MPELWQRHDLLRVTVEGWAAMLHTRPDLNRMPMLEDWARQGWPVMVRRLVPGDLLGMVPVAVPLPPSQGKQRIGLSLDPDIIVEHRRPTMLNIVASSAPVTWHKTIHALLKEGHRLGIEPCVFGGLLWQYETGLSYLSASSDIDLVWLAVTERQALELVAQLTCIEQDAPMRIDGELLLPDGGGVNWREFASGTAEVMAKTMDGIESRAATALFQNHRDVSPPIRLTRSQVSTTEAIAQAAVTALLLEVETYPKPGLVSHVDVGSHADMDAAMFRKSAMSLRPFYAALAVAGGLGADMSVLRGIGLDAEQMMLRVTGGVNTHRGAIFNLGLLCAAAGVVATEERVPRSGELGCVVRERWGAAILEGPIPHDSHGAQALFKHTAGGARVEASLGFPAVYETGLPAFLHGRAVVPGDEEAVRVQACFALIARLEDTNLLYRSGADGLKYARDEAERFLAQGGVSAPNWRTQAIEIHHSFVARWLSPGGSADMLAATLLVNELECI